MSIDFRGLSVRVSLLLAGTFGMACMVGCAHLTEELSPEADLAVEAIATEVELPSTRHTVAPGETAWAIARRYDLTVAELVELNAISDVRQIPVGMQLVVPEVSELAPAPERPDVAAGPVDESDPTTHAYRVRHGETLWGIAKRHGVSSKQLAAANGLREPERLREGRVIQVPTEPLPQECACEPLPTVEAEPPQPVACEVLPEPASIAPALPAHASDQPYAAIDAILGVGDDYLDSAHFDEAIDMADLGLDLLGEYWIREDAGPRIARAELLRGIAHVALNRPSEGRASFRAALRVEPEIVLGTNESPKVQEIFDSAREEVVAAVAIE